MIFYMGLPYKSKVYAHSPQTLNSSFRLEVYFALKGQIMESNVWLKNVTVKHRSLGNVK